MQNYRDMISGMDTSGLDPDDSEPLIREKITSTTDIEIDGVHVQESLSPLDHLVLKEEAGVTNEYDNRGIPTVPPEQISALGLIARPTGRSPSYSL